MARLNVRACRFSPVSTNVVRMALPNGIDYNRSMKIVQVIPNFNLGGIQKAGCVLARYIAEAGHQVVVLGSGGGPRYMSDTGRPGLRHVIVDEGPDAMATNLAEVQPDVLHIHAGEYPLDLLDAIENRPDLAQALTVVTPVFGRPPEDRSLLQRVHTCCVGIYTLYRLTRWLGLSADQAVEAGLACVPLTPFEPADLPMTANDSPEIVWARRRSLGVPEDVSFVVGRIGRKSPEKWHPGTADLISRLLTEMPNAAWLSLGLPEERGLSALQARWKNRFINFPETPDYQRIAEILSSLDVQIFMSVHGECFASSICEPAGLGVPTVALSNPLGDNGQVEQVIDGVTGYLVGSSTQALEQIAFLRDNPEQLAKLKAATYKHAQEHWLASKVANDLLDLYQYWKNPRTAKPVYLQQVVYQTRKFAEGYHERLNRIHTHGILQRAIFSTKVRAVEYWPTFKVGRAIKRWRQG